MAGGVEVSRGSLAPPGAPIASAIAARAFCIRALLDASSSRAMSISPVWKRADRSGEVPDNRVFVARNIAGVAVLEHAGMDCAEQLCGAHHRDHRSAAAGVLRKGFQER